MKISRNTINVKVIHCTHYQDKFKQDSVENINIMEKKNSHSDLHEKMPAIHSPFGNLITIKRWKRETGLGKFSSMHVVAL